MAEEHPARAASLKSRECVHRHDKEGWLALYAENAVIEDPIGVSPLDETGKGHATPEAREAFWDKNIANSDIEITIHNSYACGNECANIVTLKIVFDLGKKKLSQQVDGVFTYHVNEEGKLLSLRGFWELKEALKTLKPVE
jgi:steroid delta-isomerase